MQRMISSGLGRPEFDPEMGGAETALSKLAIRIVNPTGSQVCDKFLGPENHCVNVECRLFRLYFLCVLLQGLAKAFADLDADGSGYLDGPELVKALKVLEPSLLEDEVNQSHALTLHV